MPPTRKLTILNLEERVVPAFTLNEMASTVTFTGDATGDTLTVTTTANSIAYQVNGGPRSHCPTLSHKPCAVGFG